MQPKQPPSPQICKIKITLGSEPTSPPPLTMRASLLFLSSKLENTRFNQSQYLNTELPINSILLQLETKTDADKIAIKINKIVNSQKVLQQFEKNKISIQVIGKNNKLFIVITSEKFKQILSKFQASLNNQQLKNKQQLWMKIDITSNNNLKTIYETSNIQGLLRAFLDSLTFNFTFTKTQNIVLLLKHIFKHQPLLTSILQSFSHLNLDLKLSSTAFLQNFPKFTQTNPNLQIKDIFGSLKQDLSNKLVVFVFGKPLSITASINAEDIYLLFNLLFS